MDFKSMLSMRTYTTVVLCTTVFFLFADQNLLAPNLTAIAHDFGFDNHERDEKLGGNIAFGFFIVGGTFALVIGYFTDIINRCMLFGIVVAFGESACLATFWVKNYSELFLCRVLTGISFGGATPIIFSILGDHYSGTSRIYVSTMVGIASSAGISGGQLLAGMIGPASPHAWRIPFLIVAVPAILCAILTFFTVKEPKRGESEDAFRSLHNRTIAQQGQQQQQRSRKISEINTTNITLSSSYQHQYSPDGYLLDDTEEGRGGGVATNPIHIPVLQPTGSSSPLMPITMMMKQVVADDVEGIIEYHPTNTVNAAVENDGDEKDDVDHDRADSKEDETVPFSSYVAPLPPTAGGERVRQEEEEEADSGDEMKEKKRSLLSSHTTAAGGVGPGGYSPIATTRNNSLETIAINNPLHYTGKQQLQSQKKPQATTVLFSTSNTREEGPGGVRPEGIEGVEGEEGEEDMSYSEKIECSKVLALFTTPSILIIFLQGFPGCLPWGMIFVFLNDYLSEDRGMSVQAATTVLTCFGVGGLLGQLFGGWLGQRLYNLSKLPPPPSIIAAAGLSQHHCLPADGGSGHGYGGGGGSEMQQQLHMPYYHGARYQCYLMGGSTLLAILPALYILNTDPMAYGAGSFYIMAAIFGWIVNMNGPNVRAVLQNVCMPEIRGTAFSVFTLTDDIGKGFGPALVVFCINDYGGERRPAFNTVVLFWIFCGLMLLLLSFTVEADEKRVQVKIRESLLRRSNPSILYGSTIAESIQEDYPTKDCATRASTAAIPFDDYLPVASSTPRSAAASATGTIAAPPAYHHHHHTVSFTGTLRLETSMDQPQPSVGHSVKLHNNLNTYTPPSLPTANTTTTGTAGAPIAGTSTGSTKNRNDYAQPQPQPQPGNYANAYYYTFPTANHPQPSPSSYSISASLLAGSGSNDSATITSSNGPSAIAGTVSSGDYGSSSGESTSGAHYQPMVSPGSLERGGGGRGTGGLYETKVDFKTDFHG